MATQPGQGSHEGHGDDGQASEDGDGEDDKEQSFKNKRPNLILRTTFLRVDDVGLPTFLHEKPEVQWD